MVTVKIYDKDNFSVILERNYEHLAVMDIEDLSANMKICMLKQFLPIDEKNLLEELVHWTRNKVILEVSDTGGIIIRVLGSLVNYKVETENGIIKNLVEVLSIGIDEKIYSLTEYKENG